MPTPPITEPVAPKMSTTANQEPPIGGAVSEMVLLNADGLTTTDGSNQPEYIEAGGSATHANVVIQAVPPGATYLMVFQEWDDDPPDTNNAEISPFIKLPDERWVPAGNLAASDFDPLLNGDAAWMEGSTSRGKPTTINILGASYVMTPVKDAAVGGSTSRLVIKGYFGK